MYSNHNDGGIYRYPMQINNEHAFFSLFVAPEVQIWCAHIYTV